MTDDKFIYCPNPKCVDKGAKDGADKRTRITPETALYKSEAAGRKTQFFYAPKTLSGKWAKKVISPVPGCRKLKMNANTVYCPNCHSPVYLDRDTLRVAVAGPTNCGKTVYLTVLNELLGTDFINWLSFTRESSTDAFVFDKIESDVKVNGYNRKQVKYVLPRGTREDEINYMRYLVRRSNSSGRRLRDETSGREGKNVIDRQGVELDFYDVAGEWFKPKDGKLNVERNVKLAHLYNADLILFMIDCQQVIENDATLPKKRTALGLNRYLQALRETIEEVNAKGKKNHYLAFCFLAVDILKDSRVEDYKKIVLTRNYNFYDTKRSGFKYQRYLDGEELTCNAFMKFKDEFLSQKDSKIIDLSRTGFFAISSLGDEKIIPGDYTTENRESLNSFSPLNCWGVLDPILWFLSGKGYIERN